MGTPPRLLKQLIKDNGGVQLADVQKQTVTQYMNNWLNTIKKHELKDSSYDRLELTLKKQVFPYIGYIQITSLTHSDIQGMINKLTENNYAYNTIKKAYDAVKGCFRLSYIRKEIPEDITYGIILPTKIEKANSDIKYLNDDEIKKIITECNRKYQSGNDVYWLGQLIVFLIYTGLRIGEAIALNWEDVNLDNKTLSVHKSVSFVKNRNKESKIKYIQQQEKTKTYSSERDISLNDIALKSLLQIKEKTFASGFVFCKSNNKRFTHSAADKLMRAICRNAGLDEFGVHVLRHTFASLLFRKGVDVKIVSMLLGHSSVSITYNTYIHLIKEQQTKAVDMIAMNNLINK